MNNQTQYYRIRIKGFLNQTWDNHFSGFHMTEVTDPDHSSLTAFEGPVKDQAHLYGIISKMRDLGFVLVDINQIHGDK